MPTNESSSIVCEGCDQVVPVNPYRLTYTDGTIEPRVYYCDDCADLARMNWNGETAAIERAPLVGNSNEKKGGNT